MLYMAVTNDKYELPVAIEDSVIKLAKLLGVTKGSIYHRLDQDEPKGMVRRHSCIKYVSVEEDIEDGW